MKKILLGLIIFTINLDLFAEKPKKYVEDKYGGMAFFFDEDLDDKFTSVNTGRKSQIYFYNSTDEDVCFEFHEIQTKFGQVTTDKAYPIKGRTGKVKVKAHEYFDAVITLGDIEHMVFIFNEEDKDKYEMFVYADKIDTFTENKLSGLMIDGSGGVSSSTKQYYTIIFEIAEK